MSPYSYSFIILSKSYFFHEELKSEVLDLLKVAHPISREYSNVKASHTEWDWEPENLKIRNLKAFIRYNIGFKRATSCQMPGSIDTEKNIPPK